MTSSIQEFVTINGIVAILAGSLGFIIRKIWETIADRREKTRVLRLTQRIKFLEKALKKFYWPMYIMLCKDIVVWRKNSDLTASPPELTKHKQKTLRSLENSIIIPNHTAILKKLRKFSHLAEPDAAFKEQILLYIKHASLYICLRKSGDNTSLPKDFGAPFPMEFVKIIEKNTNELQYEYNSLLGIKHDKSQFLNQKVADLLGRKTPLPAPPEKFYTEWYKKLCSWKNGPHSAGEETSKELDIELGNHSDTDTDTEADIDEYFTSNSLIPEV